MEQKHLLGSVYRDLLLHQEVDEGVWFQFTSPGCSCGRTGSSFRSQIHPAENQSPASECYCLNNRNWAEISRCFSSVVRDISISINFTPCLRAPGVASGTRNCSRSCRAEGWWSARACFLSLLIQKFTRSTGTGEPRGAEACRTIRTSAEPEKRRRRSVKPHRTQTHRAEPLQVNQEEPEPASRGDSGPDRYPEPQRRSADWTDSLRGFYPNLRAAAPRRLQPESSWVGGSGPDPPLSVRGDPGTEEDRPAAASPMG